MADINSMGFAKAPKTLLLNSEVSDRGFRIGVLLYDLIRLSQRVQSKNYTWSGDKAIANFLGISPRTAQRAVKELADLGYLKKAYIPYKDKKYRIIYMGEAPDSFVEPRLKGQALKDLERKTKKEQNKIHKGEYTEATTIEEKTKLHQEANLERLSAMKKISKL
jgi:predicted transcriptional regulator